MVIVFIPNSLLGVCCLSCFQRCCIKWFWLLNSSCVLIKIYNSLIKMYKQFKGKGERTQPCLSVLSKSFSPRSCRVWLPWTWPLLYSWGNWSQGASSKGAPALLVCLWPPPGLLSLKCWWGRAAGALLRRHTLWFVNGTSRPLPLRPSLPESCMQSPWEVSSLAC